MITDIFARRYASIVLRPQYFLEDHRFLNQAAVMVANPLWVAHSDDTVAEATEAGLKAVHDTLALELGRERLSDQWWWNTTFWNGKEQRNAHKYSFTHMVQSFLRKVPEDVSQGDAWVKERLSLVELAFRNRAAQLALLDQPSPLDAFLERREDWAQAAHRIRVPGNREDGIKARNDRLRSNFSELISDLNERMRLAGYKLHYHNGFIQLADDALTAREVAAPFWALVSDPRFASVDLQLKEAIDRRDQGDRTSAFHAVSALESCIKIICDIKGWTTGTEKGAANYIDHLNSKRNGRMIEPWEAETLKAMFADVRNPFAHGPGQGPLPSLGSQQTQWAIDTAMAWTKALLTRLN